MTIFAPTFKFELAKEFASFKSFSLTLNFLDKEAIVSPVWNN